MNLFKLKKDGKCVGYEQTFFYPNGSYAIGHRKPNKAAFVKIITVDPDGVAITNMRKFIIHDEKVPYVCDDKNGEKVFAGDKTVGVVFMEDSPLHQAKGIVEYYKASYCIASNSIYYQINDLLEIELIKDTDHE